MILTCSPTARGTGAKLGAVTSPLGVMRGTARQEQLDERTAEDWRGDLDPLANSVNNLLIGH